MKEDRIGEDNYMATGATKPLHCHSSKKTTTTHNEHLVAEPLKTQQDPINQIAMAIEKLASRITQLSLFHMKNTLTFNEKFKN